MEAVANTMTQCPLCRRPRRDRAFKTLYGGSVCRRCYHAFGNRRQLAFLIDWVLWYFTSYAVGVAATVMLLVGRAPEPVITWFLVVGAYVAAPLAFFAKDGFRGCSPGRVVCGVQVVDRHTHRPIGFRASVKRNLVLYVPVMPLVIGFGLLRGHRIGDGWAGTKVIWSRYADHPLFCGRDACAECGYDLTGNVTGVCPECGTLTAPAHRAAAAVPLAEAA